MRFQTDLTLGQYAPRQSFIHLLDPRTKMIILFILMGSVFFINRIECLILFLVGIILLYPVAHLRVGLAWNNIRAFFWLFLITICLHGFFTAGIPICKIPFTNWALSQEGLIRGLFYSIRMINFILLASLMTLTTSPMSLTDGLERLLNPFEKIGIPAHEIAMIMSISMRFIPILLEETERIRKAQVSRGADFEGNPIKKIQSLVPILIPLFLSAFRKANDLALAMDARCYRGGRGRTSFQKLIFTPRDGLAAGCTILFFIAILSFQKMFV
ncbi:energy-coupling factor transporter transmembrane protein EcfT [candidate division KSB1 bacterium]|nr:energy-coupling factor transporter transmembrane protein EcfT [candidate division KSB1 bacterium]